MKPLHTLRRIRVIVATLVMISVCLIFFDFRNWLPVPFKYTLTSIQFVPAYLSLTHGVLFGLVCLLILAISACFGRIYCSAICPLGILQDVISWLAAFFRRKKIFLGYKKPHNKIRYSILAIVIISVIIGGGGFFLAWLDPYSQFGRIASTLFRPVIIYANNSIADFFQHHQLGTLPRVKVPWVGIGVFLPPLLIATLITILAVWRGRLYCNTICPVGALLGLASKFSLWKLGIDEKACRKCGDCMRSCKTQSINLRAGDIDFSRCVTCYNCLSVCDEHGIKYRWQGIPFLPQRRRDTENTLIKKSTPEKNRLALLSSAPLRLRGENLLNLDRRNFITATAIGAFTISGGSLLASVANPDKKTDANGHDFIHAVLPPGAQNLDHFLSHCTACQLCVSACPSHVLESSFLEYAAISGFMKPRLNADKSFCNINCTVCGEACPDHAILPLTKAEKQTTRIGLAHVEPHECIIYKDGTSCGACAEHCPTAALQISPLAGYHDPMPVVSEQYCIGCGACQYACPSRPHKAIAIRGLKQQETAKILKQEKLQGSANSDFPF
jgi:ferredoxin